MKWTEKLLDQRHRQCLMIFFASRSNPDVFYANKDYTNELAALALASSQGFPPSRSNNGFGSFSPRNGVGGSSAIGEGISDFGQGDGQPGFPPNMSQGFPPSRSNDGFGSFSPNNGIGGSSAMSEGMSNFGQGAGESGFPPNMNSYEGGTESNAFSGGSGQSGNFGY